MPRARSASPRRGSREAGYGARTAARAGKWRGAVMQDPVERDTRISSRISPSIGGTLSRHLYSAARMRATAWIPPVLWMAVILWLASDSGSADHTARVIGPTLRFLFPGASTLQIEA